MIIGKFDNRIRTFLSSMQTKDVTRSTDDLWYVLDERFEVWSVIYDNDEVVACSAVQNFQNCGRILTRFAVDPAYRSKTLQQKKQNGMTFAFQMVKEQIEYCKEKNYDHAFFSTEDKRVGVIDRHVRMAKELGLECKRLEGKYNTCAIIEGQWLNESKTCWQNICLYPLSDKEFPLAHKL